MQTEKTIRTILILGFLMAISIILFSCSRGYYKPGDVIEHKLYSDKFLVLDTFTKNGHMVYRVDCDNGEVYEFKDIEIE